MTDPQTTEAHLCRSCKLAAWKRTASGRLHPSGDGKCGWRPTPMVLPAAFWWFGSAENSPSGGYIDRHIPITKCAQYKAVA